MKKNGRQAIAVEPRASGSTKMARLPICPCLGLSSDGKEGPLLGEVVRMGVFGVGETPLLCPKNRVLLEGNS